MPKFGSNINDNGEKEFIIEGEIPKAFKENYNSFFEKFQIQNIKSDDELSYESYINKRERVCIFCGLSYPDTTFKNDAHLIPQCLGNKNYYHSLNAMNAMHTSQNMRMIYQTTLAINAYPLLHKVKCLRRQEKGSN